jgi:hypothetical protein
MKRTFLTIALVAFGVGSTARADITWTFSGGGADNGPSCVANPRCVGTTKTYFSGSPSVGITATGHVTADGSLQGMYEKNRSGDNGLGIAAESVSEIDHSAYIQLDLSAINANDPLSIALQSLGGTPPQQYDVYKLETNAAMGPTGLGSFSLVSLDNGASNFNNINRGAATHYYLAITASAVPAGSDLVLTSLTATQGGQLNTPEPGFYGILLVAMSALALPQVRRRFIPERS